MPTNVTKGNKPQKFRFALASGDSCFRKQGKYHMSPEGPEQEKFTIEYPRFNFSAKFKYLRCETFHKGGEMVVGFFLELESGKLDNTPLLPKSKVFIDLHSYDVIMQKSGKLEGKWTFKRAERGYVTLFQGK